MAKIYKEGSVKYSHDEGASSPSRVTEHKKESSGASAPNAVLGSAKTSKGEGRPDGY